MTDVWLQGSTARAAQRAWRRRDAGADGRCVVVRSGGVFCRPSCQAPGGRVRGFVAEAIQALALGVLPCAACRPELAPPAARVQTAAGGADAADWSQRLLARRLWDDPGCTLADVARGAGFRNAAAAGRALSRTFGAPPSRLPRAGQRAVNADGVTLAVEVRQPYAGAQLLEFLDRRSLPGLEDVSDGRYRRRLAQHRWLEAWPVPGAVVIALPRPALPALAGLLQRLSRVFDLAADPAPVELLLGADDWLAPTVAAFPGLRVPGAWDGFETAVRAVLGQQVSVARARDLAIELMRLFGRDGRFPTPEELVEADVAAVGMPGKRGAAVRALARAVLDGDLRLEHAGSSEQLFEQLCALPGIGPWTAGYVAMRCAGDADAFPEADWVVLRQLDLPRRAAQQRSEAWRPWRSYALLYIWQRAATQR